MGNHNSGMRSTKMFYDALRLELATEYGQRQLRQACRKAVEMAAEGDIQALHFVRDTLDGKPMPQMPDNALAIQPVFVVGAQTKDDTVDNWLERHKPQQIDLRPTTQN